MRRRRQARICALQALFSLEFNSDLPELATNRILTDFCNEPPESSVREFALQLVNGVIEHQEEIDRTIQQASTNWRLARMAAVDRNILRIGTYELLFCDDIPKRVTINEAIELGKTFGSEDSSAFINGVLDNISKRIKKD